MIACRQDGRVVVHAAGTGGSYDTLCGADTNDPAIDVLPCDLPPDAKITCEQCWNVYQTAVHLRSNDFDKELRSRSRL